VASLKQLIINSFNHYSLTTFLILGFVAKLLLFFLVINQKTKFVYNFSPVKIIN
jgi:hypothetical protein